MPVLPAWAVGGRVVWDDEHNLIFIRKGLRRSPWSAYVKTKYGYKALDLGAYGDLERVRKTVLEAIGASLHQHIVSLHPLAHYAHLRVERTRSSGGWNGWMHACGTPMEFQTADSVKGVTCPTCLAVVAEDINLKAAKIGHDRFEAAREEVRTIRAFNAFGKVVDGEKATEHDI